MSIWTTTLGRIFGSDKAVEKTFDMVDRGVDKMVFTKEEKADYHLLFLKAYEPFKIAQRFLALIVGIPFVLIHLLSAIVLTIGIMVSVAWPCETPPGEDKAAACREARLFVGSRELSKMNNATLGEPFLWIAIFYFGGGAVEGAVRTMVARREKVLNNGK